MTIMMMMMMMIMTDPFTTNLVVKGPVAKGSVVKGATSVMMVYLIRKHLNSQLLDGRGTSAFSKSPTKLNSLGLPIDHAYQ